MHIALNAFKMKRHLAGLVFVGLALAVLIEVFYLAPSRTQLVALSLSAGCSRNSAFWVA